MMWLRVLGMNEGESAENGRIWPRYRRSGCAAPARREGWRRTFSRLGAMAGMFNFRTWWVKRNVQFVNAMVEIRYLPEFSSDECAC